MINLAVFIPVRGPQRWMVPVDFLLPVVLQFDQVGSVVVAQQVKGLVARAAGFIPSVFGAVFGDQLLIKGVAEPVWEVDVILAGLDAVEVGADEVLDQRGVDQP